MNRIEIRQVEHEGKLCVKVGDKIIDRYQKFGKIGEVMHFIGVAPHIKTKTVSVNNDHNPDWLSDFTTKPVYPKEYKSFNHWWNATCGEILGCSPSQFKKHLNGLVYVTFVGCLDQQHVRKFALTYFKKGEIDSNAIKRLNECKDKLDEVKSDNIYHIAPFVYHLQASPSQLKQLFGKGLWKALTKNSFTKNKLLSSCAYFYRRNEDMKDFLVKFNEFPSSVLQLLINKKCGGDNPYFTAQYLTKHFNGRYNLSKEMKQVAEILHDTIRMAEQLGEKVKLSWNTSKLEENHDEFSKRVLRLKYSDHDFGWLKKPGVVFEVENNGYKATLLTTELQIAQEGEAQNHCVGGYASISAQGTYAIYSITKDGKRYSTASFYRDDKGFMRLSQHYKHSNQRIDCDDAKVIPEVIIRENMKLLWKSKSVLDTA